MTNREKLKAVKRFLKENGLKFYTNFVSREGERHPDVYLPSYKVMVKVSEGKEKDDEFFLAVRRKYHPLFIRDNEDVDFVLEKLQNLIIVLMNRSQRTHQKSYNKRKS